MKFSLLKKIYRADAYVDLLKEERSEALRIHIKMFEEVKSNFKNDDIVLASLICKNDYRAVLFYIDILKDSFNDDWEALNRFDFTVSEFNKSNRIDKYNTQYELINYDASHNLSLKDVFTIDYYIFCFVSHYNDDKNLDFMMIDKIGVLSHIRVLSACLSLNTVNKDVLKSSKVEFDLNDLYKEKLLKNEISYWEKLNKELES